MANSENKEPKKEKKKAFYLLVSVILLIAAFISLFIHSSYGQLLGKWQNLFLALFLALLIIAVIFPRLRKWTRDNFLLNFVAGFIAFYIITISHYAIIHYHLLLGQPWIKALLFYCFDFISLFFAVLLIISFFKLYYSGTKFFRKFFFFIILLIFFLSLKFDSFPLLAIFAFFHALRLPWMVDTDHSLRKKLWLLLVGFWVIFFWLPKSFFFHPDITGLQPLLLGSFYYNIFIKFFFIYIIIITIRMSFSLVETSRHIRSKAVLSYIFTGFIPIFILLIVLLFNFLIQVLYYKYDSLHTANFVRLREYCQNLLQSEELRTTLIELETNTPASIPLSNLSEQNLVALKPDFPGVFQALQIKPADSQGQFAIGYSSNTPNKYRNTAPLPSWFQEDSSVDFYQENNEYFIKAINQDTVENWDVILQVYIPINENLIATMEEKYNVQIELAGGRTIEENAEGAGMATSQDEGGSYSYNLRQSIKSGSIFPLPINIIDWKNEDSIYFADLKLYKSWADIFGFSSQELLYEGEDYVPQMVSTFLAIGIITIALSLILISTFIGWRINKGMRRSLDALVNGMKKIGEGDLKYKINLRSFDEYYRLANSINVMTNDLRGYMNDTLEKQKMEQEVKTATQIQQSMLPEQDPLLEEFEISSYARPAKQMGGDYYDYLLLAKNKLGVVMGDVSGHGIPAGLCMSMAKSALYNQIKLSYKVPDVLFAMNNMVHEVLRKRLLMTFCYSILNLDRKKLNFASAGHHFPYFFSSQKLELVSLESIAYPLGVRKDTRYKEKSVNLHRGDMLLFYTDGIIETRNSSDEEFGFDRFEDLLRKHWNLPAQDIRDNIIEEIDTFTEDNPQFDDITLIVIKVK